MLDVVEPMNNKPKNRYYQKNGKLGINHENGNSKVGDETDLHQENKKSNVNLQYYNKNFDGMKDFYPTEKKMNANEKNYYQNFDGAKTFYINKVRNDSPYIYAEFSLVYSLTL